MKELEADRFDFSRLSNRIASRDGQFTPAELVANLRAGQFHEWSPPGGGEVGALTHVAIHSLDATVPLGLPDAAEREAFVNVLDALACGGYAKFGTTIHGCRLEASDT